MTEVVRSVDVAHLRYPRAPITEAVLQLNFHEAWDRRTIERASAALGAEYMRSDELSFEFTINPGGSVSSRSEPAGMRLTLPTADQTIIIQPKAVIFSRLAPYPGWDAFFESGWEVFHRLRQKLGFRRVERVGARYVNRIDIPINSPSELTRLEDYVRFPYTGPAILGLKQPTAFIMQADFMPAESWARAIVRVATQEPVLIRHNALLLDIDVNCASDIPQAEAELRELFVKLRDLKNEVFVGCVTARAEALFGGRL